MRLLWRKPKPVLVIEPRKRYKAKLRPVVPDMEEPEIEAWEAEVGRWRYSMHGATATWESVATRRDADREVAVAWARALMAELEQIPDEVYL